MYFFFFQAEDGIRDTRAKSALIRRIKISGFQPQRTSLDGGVSFARFPRAPAFRAAPGARKIFGGKLALRSHHRNLHSLAANDRAVAAGRDARPDHPHIVADALRDAAR